MGADCRNKPASRCLRRKAGGIVACAVEYIEADGGHVLHVVRSGQVGTGGEFTGYGELSITLLVSAGLAGSEGVSVMSSSCPQPAASNADARSQPYRCFFIFRWFMSLLF